METEASYNLIEFTPHPRLAVYIDNYRVIEADGPDDDSSYGTMFPLGYPMIEFNLSDDWIKRPTNSDKMDVIGSNISSFTTKPFRIQPMGYIRTAVARLHPLALRKIMGDDVKKNTIFDPHIIFGAEFRETEEKIALAKDVFEMKVYLDEFFLKIFEGSRIAVDKRVMEMMSKIIFDGGKTSVWKST